MADDLTPLLSKDNNANRDSPPSGVAAEKCRRCYRCLVSALSSLRLGVRLLRGKDKRVEKRTVSELR